MAETPRADAVLGGTAQCVRKLRKSGGERMKQREALHMDYQKHVEYLLADNEKGHVASNEMCTFLILNASIIYMQKYVDKLNGKNYNKIII